MSFLKKLWIWVKKNWKLVLATLGIVGLCLSIYFFKDNLKDLEILKRKIDISKKKKEIISLEAQKEAIQASREVNKDKVEAIDARLEAIDKDINKRRLEISKITLNQRLEELDKLGY